MSIFGMVNEGGQLVLRSIVPAEVPKLALVRAMREVQIDGSTATPETPSAWSVVKAALDVQSQDVQEDWNLATVIPRTHPELLALAAALGVSDATLDAVFFRAERIAAGG